MKSCKYADLQAGSTNKPVFSLILLPRMRESTVLGVPWLRAHMNVVVHYTVHRTDSKQRQTFFDWSRICILYIPAVLVVLRRTVAK